VLASSLDYDTTIANVVRLALPLLGDFGCVDLVDADGRVRRIARAHNDRRRQAILAGAHTAPATPPDIHLSALSTGQHGLHPNVDDAWYRRCAVDAEHLQRMRDLAFRSMITVPLQHQRRVLGALTLYFADSGRRHTSSDLALAEELARRAAVALENARLFREAREAVRHRDDFLSIASHELRTPLSALRLHAETMSRLVRRGADRAAPERMAAKLDKIVAQVERLDGLLDSLLDVSHMVQGRLRMRLERVDLADVVRDVVARFDEELEEAGCAVRLRADKSANGLWDPLRLDQVVTNLLTNAIKYGKGGPIEITVNGEIEAAHLTVRDHGIGIPAQDQPRIFRRFERAASERHYGGLGLGLWITRRIVEALGGAIQVDSVPGKGATFTVELPR
jgi:signal transduction histidine kinase